MEDALKWWRHWRRAPPVEVWGTGEASRDFLYAGDYARGILLASRHYDSAGPVDLHTGSEIHIRHLDQLIADLVGYKGTLVYNTAQADGQPRRSLDTSRARELFGFEAATPFRTGLRSTIEWYLRHRRSEPGAGD